MRGAIWFIAWRQLIDRKLLSLIAVGGVALGVITLVAMNAIMQGFQMKFKGELLRISPHVVLLDRKPGLGQSVLAQVLPEPLAAHIFHALPADRTARVERPVETIVALEAMPEVEAACPGLTGQALLSRGTQSLGVELHGVSPKVQERCTPISPDITEGSFHALESTSDGLVLGASVAEQVGARLDDRLSMLSPGGQPISLRLVGIFETGMPAVDKTRAYVSLDTAQEVLRRPSVIGQLDVRLRDPWRANELAARARAMTGHDAESWMDKNKNFLSLFGLQAVVLQFVVGAILIVGGFGILAIQIMLVLQKTRDIAILRSVGLRRADILFIFVIQGALIALVGAGTGDLIAWRLVSFLGTLRVNTEGILKSDRFVVYDDPHFYLWGFIFALTVGLTASLVPAWRASRVEPVEVLRGQIG